MKHQATILLLTAALVLTGAAGLYLTDLGAPLLHGSAGANSSPKQSAPAGERVASPLDTLDSQAQAPRSSTVKSDHFATLSEPRQIALLKELMTRADDNAIQQFANLVQSVMDKDLRTRLLASLDLLADEAAVEMVASFLRITESPEIITAVQRTLSRAAQPETATYLAEMAIEPGRPEAQRRFALETLSMIRNPAAIEGLRDVVADFPDDETTASALISLGKIRSAESVAVLLALFDKLPPERFAARQAVINALSASASEENLTLLQDLATNHDQPLIRQAALEALRQVEG